MGCRRKKVVITGATGTVGQAIIKALTTAEARPSQVVGIDNFEQGVFDADLNSPDMMRFRYKCLDIRDLNALHTVFSGASAVIHCAAMKHVGVCEVTPDQAVATNIIGTQMLLRPLEQMTLNVFCLHRPIRQLTRLM